MSKTVLISGATGLIGREIVNSLLNRGDKVIIVTTDKPKALKILSTRVSQFVTWDELNTLAGEKIDAIINLAGKNIGENRWSNKTKKEIYDSRILSTRKIVEMVKKMKIKPGVLVNASGADYYGNRGDEKITEDSPPGYDFLSGVCIDWEKEAYNAEDYGVKVVIIRNGFVLAKEAPAVKKLVLPFKLFVGGAIGSGRQYVSWIHIDDITKIYIFAIDNVSLSGAVNGVSPEPLSMKEFCKNIGKVMHRPSFFPIPSVAVKIIAGEMSQVVLHGRKAFPDKLIKNGFKFKFQNCLHALKDII
ncbi:MAG TPA: TIGR01777 family oxidoreductase [Ignavibacteria bacterium]|nr:TIGR01777 family oxidoreductase [Ignavibacteria bacterium]